MHPNNGCYWVTSRLSNHHQSSKNLIFLICFILKQTFSFPINSRFKTTFLNLPCLLIQTWTNQLCIQVSINELTRIVQVCLICLHLFFVFWFITVQSFILFRLFSSEKTYLVRLRSWKENKWTKLKVKFW